MHATSEVMKPLSKNTGSQGRIRALTLEQLHQLTTEDLRRLAEFADRRPGSLPRSRFSADDAVQKALLSVLIGTTKGDAGRRPTAEHLHSKDK